MIRRFGLVVLAVALVGVTQKSPAAPIVYTAPLNAGNENPPTGTQGTGFAEVDFDSVTNLMHVNVTFMDLSAPTTASHIHSPAIPPANAGVATTVPSFPDFPIGVTSGTFDNTFDMTMASSYNPVFVATFPGTGQAQVLAAEAGLAASLAAGTAYLNIHTTQFPNGEIRGFLAPAVPEPASIVLLGTGVLGMLGLGWMRRRAAAA